MKKCKCVLKIFLGSPVCKEGQSNNQKNYILRGIKNRSIPIKEKGFYLFMDLLDGLIIIHRERLHQNSPKISSQTVANVR